jgi:hypothetical protein
MRKLIYAAVVMFALVALVGASAAYAGDCCKPKCSQDTCTTKCKPKCDPCKPKCEPACKKDCCKPKCEPKCESKCKPKCKQDTCTPKCKPKCEPKCDPCKPKCKPSCKKSCCEPKCDPCGKKEHPYAAMWRGAGMMCDTGCCSGGFCIPECVTCKTVCKTVEHKDPCTGCVTVDYQYETVCEVIKRPRVIPWWFNETGAGNIYLDEEE